MHANGRNSINAQMVKQVNTIANKQCSSKRRNVQTKPNYLVFTGNSAFSTATFIAKRSRNNFNL